MPILHSWEGRRRIRPQRPNFSVPPTRSAITRSASSGTSSPRAACRTRPSWFACRLPSMRGTAASWPLFTDLPPRRPRPSKLLSRIRAALRGEDRPARDGRADRDPEIPGTDRIMGSQNGPGPRGYPWAQGYRWRPDAQPPGIAAVPAPLVFPSGSGVRFTIGRTRDCDLCLTDLSVSRMHALLMRREDGWVLSDLGSHNGTRLNGWLVREPVPVHAGRPGGVRLHGVRHPGRSSGGSPRPRGVIGPSG